MPISSQNFADSLSKIYVQHFKLIGILPFGGKTHDSKTVLIRSIIHISFYFMIIMYFIDLCVSLLTKVFDFQKIFLSLNYDWIICRLLLMDNYLQKFSWVMEALPDILFCLCNKKTLFELWKFTKILQKIWPLWNINIWSSSAKNCNRFTNFSQSIVWQVSWRMSLLAIFYSNPRI